MFSFPKMLKYVWPQMKKFKWAFYWIIILFGLRTVFGAILQPFYFKKIIDVLSNDTVSRALISHEILVLVVISIVFNFLSIAAGRSGRYVHSLFEANVVKELRNYTFQKIEQNSYTFFSNTFAGSLVTKVRRFIFSFETMFDTFIFSFLRLVIILAGVFIVLFSESRLIVLILAIWIVIHVSVVTFFVIKKMKYDMLEAEQDSKISGRLSDVFSNILAVKFFSARNNEIKSFGHYAEEGRQRSKKASFFGANIALVQGIIVLFVQSFLLYIMIHLWLKDQISTGTVVLVQSYMIIIFDLLWDLSDSLGKFMKAASDMKEVVDILEIKPDILDPENPEALRTKEGHIVFKDIHFKYAVGDEVLSGFNLDIKPGERVGIVGHSGAGKSTITRLLLRSNDATRGTISIDGQNIVNVTQDNLRNVISYVPQEPILFHRPVRENIAYGKPSATDEEIFSVAKKAHAHEFVSKLSKGYDTLIGERGVKLSGGERQRVAIARAMLKDAPILILDEATSSLDSISESYIQDAFGELMKGKTTIVIAHRLSTIQRMDRIIVLDNGKIVEEGTHKELLGKKGLYADLWDHQTGGFLE